LLSNFSVAWLSYTYLIINTVEDPVVICFQIFP
jgi:hypothetical protein